MLSPIFIHYIFHPRKTGDITIYPIGFPAASSFVLHSLDYVDKEKRFSENSKKTTVFIGKEQVIKHIENGLTNPKREIQALTSLEINNIVDPSLQYGLHAWKDDNGDTFVSTVLLNGQKPDKKDNKLNECNLSDLTRAISRLDCPGIYKNLAKGIFAPSRLSFPVHYDLRAGNVLVSPRKAGILDFEYLDFYNLFSQKSERMHHNFCNLSDIPSMPSNLRNMECRLLLPYLLTDDKTEAKKLFEKYLKIKSIYWERQSENYLALANSLVLSPLNLTRKKKLRNIAKQQKIHSEILKNPTDEIKLAEAIKIQIAGFIYILSTHYHANIVEINPQQVKKYFKFALSFFENKISKTAGSEKIYFSDCYNLIKKWYSVIPYMDSLPNYYESILGHKIETTNGFKHILYTEKIQKTLEQHVLDREKDI